MKYDSSNTPDYEDNSLTGTPKQESCEVTAVTSSNKGTLTITVLNEDDVAPGRRPRNSHKITLEMNSTFTKNSGFGIMFRNRLSNFKQKENNFHYSYELSYSSSAKKCQIFTTILAIFAEKLNEGFLKTLIQKFILKMAK